MYSYKKYDYDGKFTFHKRIWGFLKRKFPEFPLIYYKQGKIYKRKFTTGNQLLILSLLSTVIIWSAYTSYMYFGFRGFLKEADSKVERANTQYVKILNEVMAYKDNVSSLNDRIDRSTLAILDRLDKSKVLNKDEKAGLTKQHQSVSAELDYVNKKMTQFAQNQKFADINTNNDYYKVKNMEIQRDIAWQEQVNVRKRNEELEKALIINFEVNKELYSKIEAIADKELSKLEKDFTKIRRTMEGLGLANKKTLLSKLEDSNFIGGPYIPLKEKELNDKELHQQYGNLREKINLWEGLTKLSGVLPVGSPVKDPRITSSYGVRTDPFTGVKASHKGIDFAGQIGTPLRTVNAGVVKNVGKKGAYGNVVEIDHGLGFTTLFAHLEKGAVKEKDIVKVGQIIGYAGSTGRSTGPHLHYEIRYNGKPINPYNFVKTEFEKE